MIKKLLFLVVFYTAVSQSQAYAYLDPGTGAIILQAIVGFIAATGAAIVLYWRKFKEFIKKILKFKNIK
jgi:hypothetical protein|tara:strand:- start:126 stop:332 length:207 start_codon:yes stop_codon:yes gene_type:complete